MSSRTPALEARGLLRHYLDGERRIVVLEGLDLVVEPGATMAIIGESGVGKSTLLHLLGALDRPDGGQVLLQGDDLMALGARELAAARNRGIGFVFQFHHLLGDFDALETVMMPLLVQGQSHAKARRRATEVLARVGLAERLTHRPGELSGGEQQRVAVARAVVGEPTVVLADEPTGNLDPRTADDVHELLLGMQKERGCALVVATHNPTLATLLDRTLRLEAGKLREVRSS
jgi:lipoprotein-releasing system ATP-binding protein